MTVLGDRIDRLFDRVGRLDEHALRHVRATWDAQSSSDRVAIWERVTTLLNSRDREHAMDDARSRIAESINNPGSGLPAWIAGARGHQDIEPLHAQQAIAPAVLDAIAAIVVGDSLTADEKAFLTAPLRQVLGTAASGVRRRGRRCCARR